MSFFADPIRQIGFVVRDIDAAIHHWTRSIGVGPFIAFRHMAFAAGYRYRGQAAEAPVVSIAIAMSGSLQVELIQQHNDAPSGYLDFLASGREGFQHVCHWYAAPPAYDGAHAELLRGGHGLVHEGRPEGMSCRFAYFAREEGGWPELEISEALLPELNPLNRTLDRLAAGWDGGRAIVEPDELARLLATAGEAE